MRTLIVAITLSVFAVGCSSPSAPSSAASSTTWPAPAEAPPSMSSLDDKYGDDYRMPPAVEAEALFFMTSFHESSYSERSQLCGAFERLPSDLVFQVYQESYGPSVLDSIEFNAMMLAACDTL